MRVYMSVACQHTTDLRQAPMSIDATCIVYLHDTVWIFVNEKFYVCKSPAMKSMGWSNTI